jgi:hypothetical protein
VRASIREDQSGANHFTNDQSTTLLQFDDSEIRSVARMLDERIANLVKPVGGRNSVGPGND